MSKSFRDRARFEVKRMHRAWDKLIRQRPFSWDEYHRIQFEHAAQRAADDKKYEELREQGGWGSHKKGNPPRTKLGGLNNDFLRAKYTGEYNDKETGEATEIIDEG